MQHLDTSGTSKHEELAHACKVTSCAHKGCTCSGILVGRVSSQGKLRSRIRSRAATYQSLKMVLAAPRLALRLTGMS